MKFCPTCGQEVQKQPGRHDQKLEVNIAPAQCPNGHKWVDILDDYGGIERIEEFYREGYCSLQQ